MVNLPDHLYEDYSQLTLTPFSSSAASSSSAAPMPSIVYQMNPALIFRWINDFRSLNPAVSDFSLLNLVNVHNDNNEFLPRLLWYSNHTVGMMLQEVSVACRHLAGRITLPFFPPLKPARVYNVLLLFQGIALHPETRPLFLKAKMPHYFYPLMDIGVTDKLREKIRLGALGVIAHLLKTPFEGAAIRFLMDTGAFNFCIKPIEFGSTESKTVAVFILQKIMSSKEGLQYCVVLPDRFFAIIDLLQNLLVYISNMARPSSSLFSLVVSCYSKISQNHRARLGLRRFTPVMLFNGTFTNLLARDPDADNHWKQLIKNMEN
ncbi:hypothetical protein V5N11_013916 [Cardamine amara subsp. amara]|uniref:Uncharacterized protein n=1 Tax=Cardamine amara subsp. amara TaxID=228776 RepID=A0ABD1BI92_CARAN